MQPTIADYIYSGPSSNVYIKNYGLDAKSEVVVQANNNFIMLMANAVEQDKETLNVQFFKQPVDKDYDVTAKELLTLFVQNNFFALKRSALEEIGLYPVHVEHEGLGMVSPMQFIGNNSGSLSYYSETAQKLLSNKYKLGFINNVQILSDL